MEATLNLTHLKGVLAKNIDIKDTLDYALFGIQEPGLFEQFLLLGPILSGFKTHRYFVGITTSGIVFVEVNSRFEEKKHRFYKYYEIDTLEEKPVLKGKKIILRFKKGDPFHIVLPRLVLGLSNHEEDAEAAIRVIGEKIKASKEYFKKLKGKQSGRTNNNRNRNSRYHAGKRKKKREVNRTA